MLYFPFFIYFLFIFTFDKLILASVVIKSGYYENTNTLVLSYMPQILLFSWAQHKNLHLIFFFFTADTNEFPSVGSIKRSYFKDKCFWVNLWNYCDDEMKMCISRVIKTKIINKSQNVERHGRVIIFVSMSVFISLPYRVGKKFQRHGKIFFSLNNLSSIPDSLWKLIMWTKLTNVVILTCIFCIYPFIPSVFRGVNHKLS